MLNNPENVRQPEDQNRPPMPDPAMLDAEPPLPSIPQVQYPQASLQPNYPQTPNVQTPQGLPPASPQASAHPMPQQAGPQPMPPQTQPGPQPMSHSQAMPQPNVNPPQGQPMPGQQPLPPMPSNVMPFPQQPQAPTPPQGMPNPQAQAMPRSPQPMPPQGMPPQGMPPHAPMPNMGPPPVPGMPQANAQPMPPANPQAPPQGYPQPAQQNYSQPGPQALPAGQDMNAANALFGRQAAVPQTNVPKPMNVQAVNQAPPQRGLLPLPDPQGQPVQQRPEEPFDGDWKERAVFAGFWKRWVAYFVDSLMIGICSMILFIVPIALLVTALHASPHNAYEIGKAVGQIFGGLIGMFYFAAFHASPWQATPGKRLLKMKVVDYNGQRLSFGRALLRQFLWGFFMLITLDISLIMAGFRKNKQALHDIVAKTYVIKTD